MSLSTHYLAPVSLWICVRCHCRADGSLFVEPAWIGAGEHAGPAIFVSRLDAEIYTTLRNRWDTRDGTNDWRCVPLQRFDLRQHMRDMGDQLNCELVIGFGTDEAGALIIACGAPRLRYIELPFDVPAEVEDVRFNFDRWIFELMRDEWASIGALSFEASLGQVAAMDELLFAQVLSTALSGAALTHAMPDREHWAVYDPDRVKWVGSAASTQPLTLH